MIWPREEDGEIVECTLAKIAHICGLRIPLWPCSILIKVIIPFFPFLLLPPAPARNEEEDEEEAASIVLPFLFQVMFGVGFPTAPQSMRTVSPNWKGIVFFEKWKHKIRFFCYSNTKATANTTAATAATAATAKTSETTAVTAQQQNRHISNSRKSEHQKSGISNKAATVVAAEKSTISQK